MLVLSVLVKLAKIVNVSVTCMQTCHLGEILKQVPSA
jgi:hypothetical protein